MRTNNLYMDIENFPPELAEKIYIGDFMALGPRSLEKLRTLYPDVYAKKKAEARSIKIDYLSKQLDMDKEVFEKWNDEKVDTEYNAILAISNANDLKKREGQTTMSNPVTMEFEKENNVHESEQDYDAVDRPKHYASTSIECIDAMIETQGEEAVIDFCVCNAFKYLWRHRGKNGDEDIRKANWYLNKAVELMDKYEKPIEF